MNKIKGTIESFVSMGATSGEEAFSMGQEYIETLVMKRLENTPNGNDFDTIYQNIIDESMEMVGYTLEEIVSKINALIDKELLQLK